MDEYEPSDPRVDDLMVRLRRQALIIERLGTEFHALLMVLMQKRLITLADVRAAERRLNLAAEVAKAQEIAAIERDVQALADELDETSGADEAA